MRKAIAKAVTWRIIGTAEIFAISFWTTGHIATAGHTAGIAAITSVLMYVAHELAWDRHEGGGGFMPTLRSRRSQVEPGRQPAVAEMSHIGVKSGRLFLFGSKSTPISLRRLCPRGLLPKADLDSGYQGDTDAVR